MKLDVTLFYDDKQAELKKIREYLARGYVIKADPNRKRGDGLTLEYRSNDAKANT